LYPVDPGALKLWGRFKEWPVAGWIGFHNLPDCLQTCKAFGCRQLIEPQQNDAVDGQTIFENQVAKVLVRCENHTTFPVGERGPIGVGSRALFRSPQTS